jgi:hypothetical protein
MKRIKARLLLLATAMFATPILAHAAPPTDGFCSHASDTAIATINFLLALIGHGPIC